MTDDTSAPWTDSAGQPLSEHEQALADEIDRLRMTDDTSRFARTNPFLDELEALGYRAVHHSEHSAMVAERDAALTEAARLGALDDKFEKAKTLFDMHHEMTYHEMCDVIAGLRAEVASLKAALAEAVAQFVHPTYPGRSCLQSAHVPVEQVAKWRAAAVGVPSETPSTP